MKVLEVSSARQSAYRFQAVNNTIDKTDRALTSFFTAPLEAFRLSGGTSAPIT